MSVKWTRERRAKFRATMKAKRANRVADEQQASPRKGAALSGKSAPSGRVQSRRDAIYYLQQAEEAVKKCVIAGGEVSAEGTYARLALWALEGKV